MRCILIKNKLLFCLFLKGVKICCLLIDFWVFCDMKIYMILSLVCFIVLAKCALGRANDVSTHDCLGVQDNRWDIRQVLEASTNSEYFDSVAERIVQSDSKAILSWITNEPPEVLAVIALTAQGHDLEQDDATKSFWSFMREPGFEVLMTEAAYRGYVPAMSILESFYDNKEMVAEAQYWNKVGTAHGNPTSLMLRGLDYIIQGKIHNIKELEAKGQNLIILSSVLGEKNAIGLLGIDDSELGAQISEFSQEEVLDAVCEIEGMNLTRVRKLLEEVGVSLRGNQVQVSHAISLIQEMNDILDDPDVTVSEIKYLLPVRQTLSTEIFDALDNESESFNSLQQAEFAWRNQRVQGGDSILEEVLLPLMFEASSIP